MMDTSDFLMNEARGFMRSRVILTAAELDLFTELHLHAFSATETAYKKGLDKRGTTRILDCLVTFGLLEKQGVYYRTTEQGSLLSSRHPQSVLPMIQHYNGLWDRWSHLSAFLRKGTKRKQEHITERGRHEEEAFIGAMRVVGRNLSQEIANTFELRPFKRLLDIGGASGTYTIAFLTKNPKMKATIFDLGTVIPIAEEMVRKEGLQERVALVAGDFYKDDLPGGCDLALLSAIIHQNSPEENLDLYEKIYRALEPGGVLAIRDHIMDESRTKPPAGALFAINMLVNTPGGDTYTFQEVQGALEKVGFRDVKWLRIGSEKMDSLIQAKKPQL